MFKWAAVLLLNVGAGNESVLFVKIKTFLWPWMLIADKYNPWSRVCQVGNVHCTEWLLQRKCPFVANLRMGVCSTLFGDSVSVFQHEKGRETKGQQWPPTSSCTPIYIWISLNQITAWAVLKWRCLVSNVRFECFRKIHWLFSSYRPLKMFQTRSHNLPCIHTNPRKHRESVQTLHRTTEQLDRPVI